MIEDRIGIEKDEGKTILTDVIIGDQMNTTVGVMRLTLTIEIIRGGLIVHAFTIHGQFSYMSQLCCSLIFSFAFHYK